VDRTQWHPIIIFLRSALQLQKVRSSFRKWDWIAVQGFTTLATRRFSKHQILSFIFITPMQLPCGEQNYGVVQQCNSRPSNSAANSCKQLFTALFLSYIKAICDATFGTYDEIMTQRSRIWELYTRNFIGLLKQYDLKKKTKTICKKRQKLWKSCFCKDI